ncbi:hypothetical protein BP6252_12063 [Coleophoma cylindrospora]|uniref:Zn(2)-C6 fungal-type domain-containing protein n=1 Tax=Coleophoma cylindrospora TaxID=1849047 RepID=A0A3D8QG76_9HELO|nr:hypothetical protein BP6252_12063 [Coleophoma cylindrospora]
MAAAAMNSPATQFSDTTIAVESDSKPKAKTQTKKRTGTTRLRTGCLTCRKRRKKCDEVYPICGHCTRLNLVCGREEPRALSPDPFIQGNNGGDVNAQVEKAVLQRRRFSILIPNPSPATILPPAHERSQRYLLKYYAQVLSMLCSTSVESNSFINVFMPMAMDSQPVLNSLLAWTAGHIKFFDESYSPVASEYRSAALVSLASALPSNANPDTTLAACLVLCAAASPTNHWYDHLQGAKSIIESASMTSPTGTLLTGTECFMQTPDGQWLLRHFAYHDVLGAVAMGTKPLIAGPYWLPRGGFILDAYVGVASEILAMISEICCLTYENKTSQVALEWDNQDWMPEPSLEGFQSWYPLLDLESRITNWECPTTTQEYLVELAESYRLAALICLYRKARDFFPSDTPHINLRISQHVAELVRILESIPYQSMAEGGLLFPLFIAGGETMDDVSISIIRTRLQGLLAHRGFAHTGLSTEILEELWRLKKRDVKSPEGRNVDWLDILKRRGIKLMLF